MHSNQKPTIAIDCDDAAIELKKVIVEHLQSRFSMGRLIHIDHYIGAVEGNNRRMFPRANQRQEMHRDVAKVDVQEPRARFT